MSPIDHVRAPAKLTRSLRVVGVRHDGFHLLEAEMATIDLADELEIEDGVDGLEVVDEVGWVLGDRPLSAGGRGGGGVCGVGGRWAGSWGPAPYRRGAGVTSLIRRRTPSRWAWRTSSSGRWPPLAGVPGCGCESASRPVPSASGRGRL